MEQSFTSWDSKDSNALAHYGIPGMKWGVRRYQKADGSLTAKGLRRYGEDGYGGRKHKMQRDFNRLDQGYANVTAQKNEATERIRSLKYKSAKRKSKLNEKGIDPSLDKKIAKYDKKIQKQSDNLDKAESRMKSIESLQYRIMGHAAKQGYGTVLKDVVRYGEAHPGRKYVQSLFLPPIFAGMNAAYHATKNPVKGKKMKLF